MLPKRFARDGLTMHPTKTALMAFSKPEAPQGSTEGNGTCDFLGLTHDWTRSRRGYWVIKRRTAHKRLRPHQEVTMAMVSLSIVTPRCHTSTSSYARSCEGISSTTVSGELPPAGGGPQRSGKGVAILAQPSQ